MSAPRAAKPRAILPALFTAKSLTFRLAAAACLTSGYIDVGRMTFTVFIVLTFLCLARNVCLFGRLIHGICRILLRSLDKASAACLVAASCASAVNLNVLFATAIILIIPAIFYGTI